jgi:FdhE protein
VNQEKDPLVEPLADDLASLTLDLLMGETRFQRASGNPCCSWPWPRAPDGSPS